MNTAINTKTTSTHNIDGTPAVDNIQNTEIYHHNGFRRVVLSHDGHVRSVMKVQRFGYFPSISTYQEAHKGDLVFELAYHFPKPFVKHSGPVPKTSSRKIVVAKPTPVEEWNVYQVNEGKDGKFLVQLSLNQAIDKWPLLRANEELNKFLTVPGEEDSHFLPAGQGWDGKKSVTEISKERKLAIFLGKIGIVQPYLSQLIVKACVSPGKNMPMNWQNAEEMPIFTRGKYMNTKTITMVEKDGVWSDLGVTRLEDGEDYYDINVSEQGITRMVVMEIDCYERQKEKYGMKWQIFAK